MIDLAWLLTEIDVLEASLVAAFTYLKSSLRFHSMKKAICDSKIIAGAFSTSFNIRVSFSLYDYIHVCINGFILHYYINTCYMLQIYIF